jgi:hypothetical protein
MSDWKPTKAQRLAKARFWTKCKDNPLLDPANIPDEDIERMAEAPKFEEWKRNPEFVAWFVNDRTVEIAIEASTEKVVDKLMEIINAQAEARGDVTTTHQLAAAKILLEYSATKAPAEEEAKEFDPKKLPDSERELLEHIQKQLGAIPLKKTGGGDE